MIIMITMINMMRIYNNDYFLIMIYNDSLFIYNDFAIIMRKSKNGLSYP